MLLVVDNSSSYFNDLVRCLNQISAKYEIKKQHELDGCNVNNYDGIILSGRTDNLKSMNVTNMRIVNLAYESDKPLLGICYGAEITALALNGSLRRLNDRIIGEHTINVNKDNSLTDKKQLNVFECHGYYIARLPQEFESIASSSSCNYEIVAHKKKQIFGTQFHPEMSKDGLEILNNFVKLTKH
ncbi:MAG: type 1 glutamine amidotransferase [Nitrososphaerales archaeon]